MKYKYYSLHRPIGIGTYPKKGLSGFENYDRRKLVSEIGWFAWGELWYDRKLDQDELDCYELEPSPSND